MEYLKIYESFFEEQKRINKEISELVKKNKEATDSFIDEIDDFLVELKEKYKIRSESHIVSNVTNSGIYLNNYTYVIYINIIDALSSDLESDINQLKLFENEYKKDYSIKYSIAISEINKRYITPNYFSEISNLSDLKKKVIKWSESFVSKYCISISIRENKIINN